MNGYEDADPRPLIVTGWRTRGDEKTSDLLEHLISEIDPYLTARIQSNTLQELRRRLHADEEV